MGGMRWGAGRPGWHVKAEHCKSIDARRWTREGILQGPRSGGWGWWTDDGEKTGSIGYHCDGNAVTLSYSVGDTSMRQQVPILTTGCNYGGRRFWFGCPHCGRRVAVLYLRARGFACRKCNRVAYASQSEDELGRTWRKQSKLERLLGENWRRPKGMHRATFERLLERITECEGRRDAALLQWMRWHGWPR
jgi:hypothetical protein